MTNRSPELMGRDDTALLVVDVQTKLLRAVPDHDRLIWNIGRLIDGARLLDMPILATEQYPRGLGPTVPALASRLGQVPEKMMFSCRECADLWTPLAAHGVCKILVCGMETHVCVQQTVLDLLADGFRVYVAVDAVRSRTMFDYEIALRRIESGGATLTTTEAALFEWCEVAGTPEFREISRMVRQTDPP